MSKGMLCQTPLSRLTHLLSIYVPILCAGSKESLHLLMNPVYLSCHYMIV